MKKIVFSLGACIVFAAFGIMVLGSCSTGDPAAASMMIGRSSRGLVFLDCKAVSEDEIEFTFSQPVKISSMQFEPEQKIVSIEEEGNTVLVKLEKGLEPGILLTADLLAQDERRNTINVIVPLRSRNNRLPRMLINEARSEQSGNRFEFIEFKMLSAGNLGALRVFIASNPKAPMVFQFMPVEVRQGEYVVLHLRTKEQEGCKDEYGGNLAESKGEDAKPAARDFWIAGNAELLRKTDIVYVLDQDDNVIDAVVFSETPDEWWKKQELAQAAEYLFSKGAWKNAAGDICGPQEAVSNAGATNTRSISRKEGVQDTGTPADWHLTASSGATPGERNN